MRSYPYIVFALLLCSSCSLIRVQGPPPPPYAANRDIPCTDSRKWPITDTVVTAVTALGAATAASATYQSNCDGDPITCAIADGIGEELTESANRAAAITLTVAAVAYGVSAIQGYRRVSKCRKVRAHIDPSPEYSLR